MKKGKLFIGIAALLIFAFVYAHIAKMNVIYDKTVDSSEYQSTGWKQDTVIEQSFISKEDRLDGINIKCQTSGDTNSVALCYSLEDTADKKVVATGKIVAEEIESTKFNQITFDTIQNCRNKEFKLKIWTESPSDIEGMSYYYCIGTEEGTEFVINGEKTEGTLVIKTITNKFDIETFCVFLIMIAFMIAFMKVLYKLFK